MAQGDHPLHIGAAEVQVAVGQPDGVPDVGVLHDLEGGRLGLGQQPQLGDLHLDIAGGQVGVLGLPLPDETGGGDDVLAPEGGGFLENIFGGAVVKGKLEQAGAVPEVHKDQAAQVPLPLDPAADGDGLADILGGKGAAVAGAAEVLQVVHGCFSPFERAVTALGFFVMLPYYHTFATSSEAPLAKGGWQPKADWGVGT